MKINGIDIQASVTKIKQQIETDKEISDSLRMTFELLLLIIELLYQRLGLNSNNSSIPPSQDQNRKRETKNKSDKKSGGQKGHKGTTLEQVDNPDIIEKICIDRTLLPEGNYTEVGFEKRQVFDIEIRKIVTEYQAQILQNEYGKKITAPFPKHVNSRVQYGNGVKAHAVYLSQYQLLPYERLREYFTDQLGIPISEGSLYNFISTAHDKLTELQITEKIKAQLIQVHTLHTDETSINLDGNKYWLHNASSDKWTYLSLHSKRGYDAMNDIGILPKFHGVLCHDHWKPYYRYTDCTHSLCNAHHLRELTHAYDKDEQAWAKEMHTFLLELNKVVHTAGGALDSKQQADYILKYQAILKEGDTECPEKPRSDGKKGRAKQTKSRNLLERLANYQDDVLRFMTDKEVPFTNNQGERDLRMAKVQQKISGCFRSEKGALMFFELRGYLASCKKQGVSSSTALNLLFGGILPDIF